MSVNNCKYAGYDFNNRHLLLKIKILKIIPLSQESLDSHPLILYLMSKI